MIFKKLSRIPARYVFYVLNTIYLILIIIYFSGGLERNAREEDPYYLNIVMDSTTNGWYYEVSFNKRLLIRQPYIPGVEHIRPFKSPLEAERIGTLVIEKLKGNLPPQIKKDDLIKNNIDFQ